MVVLASGMLLVFAEGVASFGVGRTTAAETSLGLLVLGSFIVYTLTERRR